MHYLSTRGQAPPTTLSAAILAGLAPDGGLYVPSQIPHFPIAYFDGAHGHAAIAARTLAPWFAGDALAGALDAMCSAAFDIELSLKHSADPHTQFLELIHGPTAAFKDFGARFLAQCFARLRAVDAPLVTMLVATSGDTGSAVAAAFHRMPGLRVLILYPEGRVSPRQAHQLGCFGDNVRALRVTGEFDDCQRLVKQAFADQSLRQTTPLASANSISLGRLLPQITYYADAALANQRAGNPPLNLIVPSGNLGNAFAALLARAMGLPIEQIVLATNANDVVPAWLASGHYVAQAAQPTLANAMDVGDPSNAERLRWLYPDFAELTAALAAHSVDDDEIRRAIIEAPTRHGLIVCPHTACALVVRERLRGSDPGRQWCVVATAHPAKFESIVEPLIGHPVALPGPLAAMLARASHAEPMANDYRPLRAQLVRPAQPSPN